VVSSKQDRAVQICAPRSTAHIGFRTPLAFRSLSRGGGGGVRNRGRTFPTVQMSTPGSTAMKTIPDPPPPPPPPRPSTFKRRGGVRNHRCSFRRPRSRSPDQWFRHGPNLPGRPVFNPHGPASRHVIFCPPFPCRHVSPCTSLSHLQMAFPSSHRPFITRHVSFPLHVSLSPEGESSRPLPPFLHLMSSIIFLSSCHFSHMRLTLHADLHACPSSYSVIPGGSARSSPYPEVLSWLGRSQSQEAVIEAVGGG
jgi:hypothetical protein